MSADSLNSPKLEDLLNAPAGNWISQAVETVTKVQRTLFAIAKSEDSNQFQLLKIGTVFQIFLMEWIGCVERIDPFILFFCEEDSGQIQTGMGVFFHFLSETFFIPEHFCGLKDPVKTPGTGFDGSDAVLKKSSSCKGVNTIEVTCDAGDFSRVQIAAAVMKSFFAMMDPQIPILDKSQFLLHGGDLLLIGLYQIPDHLGCYS